MYQFPIKRSNKYLNLYSMTNMMPSCAMISSQRYALKPRCHNIDVIFAMRRNIHDISSCEMTYKDTFQFICDTLHTFALYYLITY